MFVPVDYKALVPSIQKVNKAGIPVIGYINRMTDVDLVSYVGSDDETLQYELCKYLFKSMDGKGKIVHIDGVPAAITAQNRKKGFERAVKETPGIEVLASQPGNYRRLPAVQVFENLMQRFPVIDAVVCANDDMAVGIAEALIAAGRGGQARVVGIDGIPDATAAIAAGKMFATVGLQRSRPGLSRRHRRGPSSAQAAGAERRLVTGRHHRQVQRRRPS